MAVIDDDEGLTVVDADFALSEAFKSAALDEPAGGDFDSEAVGRGVGRDVGVEGAEAVEVGAADEGVHEEAAGVAEVVGVGELAVADGAEGLADVARCVGGGVAEGFTEGSVVEAERRAFLEAEIEVGDDVGVAVLVFEGAVSIGVFAGVDGEGVGLEGELVKGFDAFDDVLEFNAVGSDVLDGGGSGLAGDVREVFDASPSAIDGVSDNVVPGFSGANAEGDVGVGLAGDGNAVDAGVEDDAVEVGDEEEVASGADVERAELLEVLVAEYAAELVFVVVLHEPAGEDGQAEGVVGLEGEVFFDAHVSVSVWMNGFGFGT